MEKNAAEGPSSQTLLVNATGVHEKSSEKSRRSSLAQLHGEQRGVEAVGTGSRVTQESVRTAKLFSCNPETESCSKSHLPPASLPCKTFPLLEICINLCTFPAVLGQQIELWFNNLRDQRQIMILSLEQLSFYTWAF